MEGRSLTPWREFGPDAASAVPELIRALPKSLATDAQFPDRTCVTRALSRIAPGTESADEALAALVELLRCRHSEVRNIAADALGEFGPAAASAIPDLIRIVKETPETDTARAPASAAVALGRIAPGTASSEEVVAVLTGALQSRSHSTRYAVARALGSLGAGVQFPISVHS